MSFQEAKYMRNFVNRHLQIDFHTSGDIDGIGELFDAAAFTESLKAAKVQSVNIFSKCHHSWCYFPSEVCEVHPHLKINLTRAMVDAAHAAGAKAVLYVTVGWSEGDAMRHPEWIAKNKDGSDSESQPYHYSADAFKPYYQWKNLCINSGYEDYVVAFVEELCEKFPDADGFFLDICFRYVCHCEKCRADMRKLGMDPDDDAQAKRFSDSRWSDFAERVKKVIFRTNPDATVFFNGSSDMDKPEWHHVNTHMELEDLPTAWGGYDKMPIRAKYFSRITPFYLGMTGKFHKAWGEFGGYKTPEALKYEIASMMTYGAGCCIGDQLHPSGKISKTAIHNIAHAYEYAEKIDDFCYNEEDTSRLGVMISFDPEVDEGVAKVLLERQVDFKIALPEDDFSNFDVLILPDCIHPDEACAEKLRAYAASGKILILTGSSALSADGKTYLSDLPVESLGKSTFQNDYLLVSPEYCDDAVPQDEVLCYDSCYRYRATGGAILASVREPYFNRTYRRFCSHLTVPYRLDNASYIGCLRSGNIILFAHEIFRMYRNNGAQFHRDFFINVLHSVYRNPVLEVNLLSSGRTRLTKQPKKNRYVLHLLYASPQTRGDVYVLEDFPALENIGVTVRLPEKIRSIRDETDNEILPFEYADGKLKFSVPRIRMHKIITLTY